MVSRDSNDRLTVTWRGRRTRIGIAARGRAGKAVRWRAIKPYTDGPSQRRGGTLAIRPSQASFGNTRKQGQPRFKSRSQFLPGAHVHSLSSRCAGRGPAPPPRGRYNPGISPVRRNRMVRSSLATIGRMSRSRPRKCRTWPFCGICLPREYTSIMAL